MRRFWLMAALAAAGCYKLDPFLYDPARTDAYVFTPEGDDPQSTVTADRITALDGAQRLTTPSGIRLGAVLVRAPGTPIAPALFFHGKGPHLGGGQWHRIKRVANLGYDVLAIDYRGFGTSTDVPPTEAGIEEDTRTALEWLRQYAGEGAGIVYYGHSLGAAIATQRAELDPPAALILESAFASIEEFKRDATLLDFPDDYVARDTWPTSSRLPKVPSPVLLLHGAEDDFVRPEFSQALFEAANEPKALRIVEGADHGSVPMVLGAEYPELVNGWVQTALGGP